uniref:Glyceraldehyde-3-phosphate dehydrogenase n=1 Tax=Mustela putorius furo TaxID=9669 RepID=M3YW74_MUSPF
VAINDPFIDLNYMVYIFHYDSTLGKFHNTEKAENGKHLSMEISSLSFKNIIWVDAGAEYILESTEVFSTMEKVGAHLKWGVKMVITPSADAPMFVMDMNHETVNNASCITSCSSPLANFIHNNFGIMGGLITTVHGITTVDGLFQKLWCDGQGAAQNISPPFAAKAVGKVTPELNRRLTGMAFSISPKCQLWISPATWRKPPKTMIQENGERPLQSILGYTEDQFVSRDFNSDTYSSFDAGAGIALNDNFVKLISWYDGEFGFSKELLHQLISQHTEN